MKGIRLCSNYNKIKNDTKKSYKIGERARGGEQYRDKKVHMKEIWSVRLSKLFDGMQCPNLFPQLWI